MALGKTVSLASLGIFLLFIRDCGGFNGYQNNSTDDQIDSVLDIFSCIIGVFFCCWCCCIGRNRDENVEHVEMNSNQENQQRIVPSTDSAGVHYQPQPYTSSSSEVQSPIQLYPNRGEFNTAFQYGAEAPDQMFGTASLPPYQEPAPSHESVVGTVAYPYTTHRKTF